MCAPHIGKQNGRHKTGKPGSRTEVAPNAGIRNTSLNLSRINEVAQPHFVQGSWGYKVQDPGPTTKHLLVYKKLIDATAVDVQYPEQFIDVGRPHPEALSVLNRSDFAKDTPSSVIATGVTPSTRDA